jgi:hypothetical protein
MILDHDVRGLALAPDVGMEVGGEEARRIGGVDQQLGIRAHVEALLVEEALSHPRAVRAIVEARGVAIGGDGDRAVLPVIGDVPARDGAGPVRIIGERVAIGVIGDERIAGPMSVRGNCQRIRRCERAILVRVMQAA